MKGPVKLYLDVIELLDVFIEGILTAVMQSLI